MSQYTTGEIAKLCGVTVRTVQYYDARGILVPSELSEGGRRLYSDADLNRMKTICFLRGIGMSIDNVSKILADDDSGKVVSLLLEQRKEELNAEIKELESQSARLESLTRELRSLDIISAESIGDAAYRMKNSNKLKKIHRNMIVALVPFSILQIAAIALWIAKGWWWLYVAAIAVTIPVAIVVSVYYYRNVSYVCPGCHKVFHPAFREAFFAPHTPKTRKLTCPGCGRRGYCVEVARERADEDAPCANEE